MQNPQDPHATYVQMQTAPPVMAQVPMPPQGQPMPATPPRPAEDSIPTGEWASGLFGCFENLMPNCLMAWCCPFITLAQISHRLNLQDYLTALCFYFIVVMGSRCLWYTNKNNKVATILTIVGGACWLAQTAAIVRMRRHIRERFHIDGDVSSDCCIACCCSCCAAAQMATHVKSYCPGDCSFAAPDQLPAYQ